MKQLPSMQNPLIVVVGDVHHHHTPARWTIHQTQVIALNIISSPGKIHHHGILPGWAALFEWDEAALQFLQTWPRTTE